MKVRPIIYPVMCVRFLYDEYKYVYFAVKVSCSDKSQICWKTCVKLAKMHFLQFWGTSGTRSDFIIFFPETTSNLGSDQCIDIQNWCRFHGARFFQKSLQSPRTHPVWKKWKKSSAFGKIIKNSKKNRKNKSFGANEVNYMRFHWQVTRSL